MDGLLMTQLVKKKNRPASFLLVVMRIVDQLVERIVKARLTKKRWDPIALALIGQKAAQQQPAAARDRERGAQTALLS